MNSSISNSSFTVIDMTEPKVSVCMPIYNSAPYLAQAIESVLMQSYKDFELLIVDDCSTDGSAAIAGNYVGRDSRIRLQINPVNRGMVGNWNYCLEQARGEYVHFMFGDDYFISPEAISLKVKALNEHPDVSIVSSSRQVVDENGNFITVWQGFRDLESANPRHVAQACLKLYHLVDGTLKFGCLENFIGEPSAVMFRKTEAGHGFSFEYKQLVDLEMWFRLLAKGRFSFFSEPLIAFRRHDAQQTAKNSKDFVHIEEYLALIKQYVSFAYPLFIPPLSTFVVMSECYRITNLQKRDAIFSEEVASSSVTRVISPAAFKLMWPFYRLLQPFYKIFIKLFSPLFTSYYRIMPVDGGTSIK